MEEFLAKVITGIFFFVVLNKVGIYLKKNPKKALRSINAFSAEYPLARYFEKIEKSLNVSSVVLLGHLCVAIGYICLMYLFFEIIKVALHIDSNI